MKTSGIISAMLLIGLLAATPTEAQQFSLAASPPGSGGASFSGLPPDDIIYPGPGTAISGSGVISGLYVDVNALCYSYVGLSSFSPANIAHYEFSVSAFAPAGAAGAIVTEEGSADHIADIYSSDGTGSNLLLWDGLGPPPGTPLAGAFGVFEPLGDEVDAWANNPAPGPLGAMYWSCDTASAAAIYGGTLSPADILLTPPIAFYTMPFGGIGTPPGAAIPYAFALTLGLDTAGPATDDIDALVVIDSTGDGAFTGVGGPDVVLFSLTPGSASLTTPSPYFGAGPGDILFADSSGGSGVFLPAAALGLSPFADMDALDIKIKPVSPTISADTNGYVAVTWVDLVPPFSYTVQVANASAPYFGWKDYAVFTAFSPTFTLIDTNTAGTTNVYYRVLQDPW